MWVCVVLCVCIYVDVYVREEKKQTRGCAWPMNMCVHASVSMCLPIFNFKCRRVVKQVCEEGVVQASQAGQACDQCLRWRVWSEPKILGKA